MTFLLIACLIIRETEKLDWVNSTRSFRKFRKSSTRLHPDNHIISGIQYLVRASYLEIYQEEIRDLLSKDTKKR